MAGNQDTRVTNFCTRVTGYAQFHFLRELLQLHVPLWKLTGAGSHIHELDHDSIPADIHELIKLMNQISPC